MRTGLALTSGAAFVLAALWWATAGFLSTKSNTPCFEPTADLAFVAAHGGLVLAVAAFAAALEREVRLAGRLLGVYAVLFALSLAALGIC